MFKKLFLFLSLIFLLTSCSSTQDKQLKISATTWIGYSPLYYAKEKGWLKPLNIKLLHVSSLSENMYLYEAGNADAYVGTQYEYSVLSKKDPSLMPVMLFDRSYGGDIVMSNFSISKLQNTKDTIDVYLEMDSINNTLFKDFVQKHGLQNKNINYINRDQAYISTLKNKNPNKPTILVTYIPYDTKLEKNGFKNIASTKTDLDLLVIDALFTTQKTLHDHESQFVALKKLVDRAISKLEEDPKEFYDTIKPYILDLSYENFESDLDNIIWVNKNISNELKEQMKNSHYPMGGLL